MQIIDAIFVIAVIIMSAVVHEVMHGIAADKLGDPTARYAGRLTLNPIPHLDMFGSIILPVVLALTNSPIFFGWAKPVPYNPYNLRTDGLFSRFSEAIVAGAGPASNLAIALISGTIMRLGVVPAVNDILFVIVLVNVMLFIFNLIPIPPLDGSKVLSALLPQGLAYSYNSLRARAEYNPFLGMGLVLIFILLAGNAFSTVIWNVARFITGA